MMLSGLRRLATPMLASSGRLATRIQPAALAPLSRVPSRLLSSAAPVPTASSVAGAVSRATPLVSEPSRFAVMHLGGAQYKVATDDVIAVERLPYQAQLARATVQCTRAGNHILFV